MKNIDTTQTTTIRQSSTILILCFFGSLVLCGLFLVPFFIGGSDLEISEIMIFGGTALVGAASSVVCFRGFVASEKPVLILAPEGLSITRPPEDIIPWPAVKSIGPRHIGRTPVAVLSLDDEAKDKVVNHPIERFMSEADKLIGVDGIVILTGPLEVPQKDLVKMVEAYADAYGGLRDEHSVGAPNSRPLPQPDF